jgi:hypothetical protein
MVQLLSSFDQHLRSGDWIITGSLIHHSIDPGREIAAAIDGIGETSLRVDP